MEDWSIIRELDDKFADVRISLGRKRNVGSYIVFRGKPEDTIQLLEKALAEAYKKLPGGRYEDRRGRPQG